MLVMNEMREHDEVVERQINGWVRFGEGLHPAAERGDDRDDCIREHGLEKT